MPSDDFIAAIRRKDSSIVRGPLARRTDDALPFDIHAAPEKPILLDTNVYLDRLQGKLPPEIGGLLQQRPVFHSAVALSELSITLGILDPKDDRSEGTKAPIRRLLESIDPSTIHAPKPSAWIEAGSLAGTLARTQGLVVSKKDLSPEGECCQKGRRRALMNDTLIYLSAIYGDMLLLTRNIKDIDYLMQLTNTSSALFYRANS